MTNTKVIGWVNDILENNSAYNLSKGSRQIVELILSSIEIKKVDFSSECDQLLKFFTTKYSFDAKNLAENELFEIINVQISELEKEEKIQVLNAFQRLEVILEMIELRDNDDNSQDFKESISKYVLKSFNQNEEKNHSVEINLQEKQNLNKIKKMLPGLLILVILEVLNHLWYIGLVISSFIAEEDFYSNQSGVILLVNMLIGFSIFIAIGIISLLNMIYATKINNNKYKTLILITSIIGIIGSILQGFLILNSIPLLILTWIIYIKLNQNKQK